MNAALGSGSLGRVVEATGCTHCGQPVPDGRPGFGSERAFCCDGCESVNLLLTSSGLEDRYCRLAGADGVRPASTGRGYAELDTPEFHEAFVRKGTDGSSSATVYLTNVHCSACVWLIEALPRLVPGVVEARLNLLRHEAAIVWDPQRTTLSAAASMVDQLGYPVRPARRDERAEQARREDRALLIRVGVAGAATGNVMLFGFSLYSGFFGGMTADYISFFRWASLVVGLPGTIWPAMVFFRGALGSIRARRIHIDLPIATGIAVGLLWGTVNTIRGTGEIYFDTLTTLTFLLLSGRLLTRRHERRATDAAARLLSLTPSAARQVRTDGNVVDVLASSLEVGDLVEVRAGDVIPADGLIETGSSEVDASMLTGEALPEAVEPGARVFAGTTNTTATLRVRVAQSGESTRMGRLMQDVERLASRRAPIVRMADAWVSRFVVVILSVAAVALAAWLAVEPSMAVEHVVSLLVVTCPCALGLATPLAVTVAIGRAARLGVLLRGGDALEAASRPGTLFLDKTGTLTEGRLRLVRRHSCPEVDTAVAAMEQSATHPIARALLAGLPVVPAATEVLSTTGGGLDAVVGGDKARVGSPKFLGELPSHVAALVDEITADGLTPVVAQCGARWGVYGVGDTLRAEARTVIDELRRKGWRVGILSGDHVRVVKAVGAALGLPDGDCHGGLSPEAKRAAVAAANAFGTTMMVGDGVNDAAALAEATVGLAVHGGAEASLLAADAFSAKPGLVPLATLIDLAERTTRVIHRNLRVSATYNIVGGTLAVLGYMNPLVAAVLMPLSSLSVIASSIRSAGPTKMPEENRA